jgi:hypothetical protein
VFKCSLRFFVVQTGLRLGEDYSLYDSISLMSESVRLFLKRNELKVGPYLSCVTTDVTLIGNSACIISMEISSFRVDFTLISYHRCNIVW